MNKARKAKIRELNRKAQEREQQELAAQFQRLQNASGGFARAGTTIKVAKPVPHIRETDIASARTKASAQAHAVNKVYEVRKERDPVMVERERIAKERYEQMKLRTAPVFNKGTYTYFTDDMVDDMKSGKLSRRN